MPLTIIQNLIKERIETAEKDIPRLINEFFSDVRFSSQVRYPAVPMDVILDTARREGVDMIVIGTHGRRGVKAQFLGSVAEKVTKQSAVPVLHIRPY